MKLALLQHAYQGTPESTLDFLENQIKVAVSQGAEVIGLQELCYLPYLCRTMDPKHFSWAQRVPGPLQERFSKLAKNFGVVLMLPFFEERMPGLYHNSCMVFDADGSLLGVYRKNHIPNDPGFYEKYYFTPGDTGYPVFQTRYGKIAVLICWDQWFPEASRIVSLLDAQLIFYPTAIGILQGEEGQEKKFKDAWRTVQRAAAISNGVFVACVNRVGVEGELDFWGHSFVCDPLGEILVEESERKEKILRVDLDFKKIEETRQVWPFLRDRRIDTYGTLSKPNG
jgi:N-carbamoylputrescine amidase